MVSLYKRKNGYWYVSYYINSVRVQRTTNAKTKKEAVTFLAKLKELDKLSKSVYLSYFIQEFIEYSKVNKSPKTVVNDLRALTWLLKIIGNKKLNQITIADIERFKAESYWTYPRQRLTLICEPTKQHST